MKDTDGVPAAEGPTSPSIPSPPASSASSPSYSSPFVYRPGAVDPLLMMLIILVAIVTLIGLPVTLFDRPEYNFIGILGPAGAALCLTPLLSLVLLAVLARPTDFEVRDEGLLLPVPLISRLLGRRSLVKYVDLKNVFVTSVEFTGAKLSPFASSAGTVLHIGIGIETRDGATRSVRFTPSHLMMQTADPALCLEAKEAIRTRLRAIGKPLIQEPPGQDEAELAKHLEEAQRPLLPFPVIVASFFMLPICAFAALFVTGAVGLGPEPLRWAIAAVAAVLPAAVMFRRAWARNGRREAAINEIAKLRESEEERKSRGHSISK